jgi:glycosyltransferase involved in cell wall biosynthesis
VKILIIGPAMGVSIPPNGWGAIEKVIWKHSQELIKLGHSVEIYNERDLDLLKRLIDEFRYDIIHVHNEWEIQFLLDNKIDYIYTCHSGPQWKGNQKNVVNIFKLATFCMPFGVMSGEVNFSNSYPIHNGADEEIFYMDKKIKNSCVAIGKDNGRKGFDKITEIFKNNPDYSLKLIGPGNEKHAVSPNIEIIDNVPETEVAKHLSTAEYFFHLSEIEADGLVPREAAMSGCKMITSNHIANTLGRDICWLDVENFSDCPDNLGEKAYKYAKENFTWKVVAKKIEDGYFKYLDSKKKKKEKY